MRATRAQFRPGRGKHESSIISFGIIADEHIVEWSLAVPVEEIAPVRCSERNEGRRHVHHVFTVKFILVVPSTPHELRSFV